MRPLKAAVPLAKWLLRLALAFYLIVSFYDILVIFSFTNLTFWFAFVLVLFSILLVIGGFGRSASLTVFSGLAVFLISLASMVMIHKNILLSFDDFSYEGLVLPASIGFYFFARGNMG